MLAHIKPLIGACVALSCVAASTVSQASVAQDTNDIDHLMAAYHEAVVAHDAERLRSLFVSEGVGWFSVLSDGGLAQVRGKAPQTPKIRAGGLPGFLKLVATSRARLDPEHEHLHVQSDGAMATITFDYRFLIDAKVENRGSESWQLVKGEDGWRIASIVYSSTPSPS
jgi:hypothetical protein